MRMTTGEAFAQVSQMHGIDLAFGIPMNETSPAGCEQRPAVAGALRTACAAHKDGVAAFIEVMQDQEIGEPFRRDAMKNPVAVAGADCADFRPQPAL